MSRTAKGYAGDIPTADIRSELELVLKSEDFKRSPRLSDFLTYIVEMTLEGSAGQIKGYTIGLEVFGKPASFDAEQDASVRVDATRLRRALASYYSGEGRNDRVRISVGVGRTRYA